MKVYGYIRVSTDKQTTENQKFEIERFLKNKEMRVDKWVNETISGTVSFKKENWAKLCVCWKKTTFWSVPNCRGWGARFWTC